MCLCVCLHVQPGGLTKIGSDPVHAVNYVLEETTNMFSAILKFAANLVAPEEDDGTLIHSAHKASIELQKEHLGFSLSNKITTLQCIYSFPSPLL